jgi:autotransporter-associated beta strand protein
MIRCHLAPPFAFLALLTSSAPPVAAQTWTGAVNSDWNTAGNWSPATVPNSAAAIVNFTGNGSGGVNISSSVQAQSLTFSAPNISYDLTSNASQSLNGVQSITVTAGGAGATINLASIATGSLLYSNASALTITNNRFVTQLVTLLFGSNTVIGTPGSSGVIVSGPGITQIYGSFSTTGPPNNQVIGGLTKNGPGQLYLSNDGNNLVGGLALNGGTLDLDYSTNTSSKMNTSAAAPRPNTLTLGGGALILLANSGAPVTQTVANGTVVSAGQSDVTAVGPGTLALGAGAISRNTGGTVDFTLSSGSLTFNVTTSNAPNNGLLGTYGTVGGGSTWATVVAGGVFGFPQASYGTLAGAMATTNVDVTASVSASGLTANSLRFNTGGTVTLTLSGSSNILSNGGILVTPNGGGSVITGGTLASNSNELIVHTYGDLTINSALAATAGLTKSGPNTLTLGGTNPGLTGPINVNRGRLTVTNAAAVNSASQINFNDDRNSMNGINTQYFEVDLGSGVNGTISPPVRISLFDPTNYPTVFTVVNANSRVTLAGALSSATGLTTPLFFANVNTSGFNLTNSNTFAGNVLLGGGFLGINADANLGNAANILTLDVTSTANGGLEFLTTGVTVARSVVIKSATRIISNGADSSTISGVISGPGGIYKDGTGTLTISNPNNTVTGGVTVAAGTLSLGATGGLPLGTKITVAAGATFSPGTAVPAAVIGSVTLNGGTFRVSAGNTDTFAVNQFVIGPAGGTVDYTGAVGFSLLQFYLLNGAAAGITVNGNSSWISPGNSTLIQNTTGADVPIMIAPGVTLTNGIVLGAFAAGGPFRVTGGGTLFENADTSNYVGVAFAPLTVAQGQYRVTDASSNGGVGDLGNNTFTLDGGTFSYGGTSNATSKAVSLTANGGTVQIESAATTLTANGAITGPGPLTKSGPGTLILGSSGNTFTGLIVSGGTVQTANDNTLGGGPVTVNAFGTLTYTVSGTTSRAFTLNGGRLTAAANQTVTLNNATVAGGFIAGPGAFAVTSGSALSGVTTAPSAVLAQIGSASFLNFTNGGLLSVAAGLAQPTSFSLFTNQGSGSITVGAGTIVNAADFQTYGTLTLSPGSGAAPTQLVNTGTSNLFFNGGSRSFISIPANAGNFDAGIDLHGNNAVVAGGLFVNNGYVVDGVGAGTKTIVADYGSLVKGAGFYQNSVQTVNGGKFQSGNSPGQASFGSFTFGPGGVTNYQWQINDPGPSPTFPSAPGIAGGTSSVTGSPDFGWSLIKAIKVGPSPGNFTWTAMAASPLTVILQTLTGQTTVGNDVLGPMQKFDNSHAYSWQFVTWAGNYTGPTDSATLNSETIFDQSSGPFANTIPPGATFGWTVKFNSGTSGPGEMDLTYTPVVPEPGALALTGLAGLGLACLARRRKCASPS